MTRKVVVLAGGQGSRLGEISEVRPKPMVEIGGQPILWHVMKCYAHFGFGQFAVALGYKGDMVRRYFLEYGRMHAAITVDLRTGKVQAHDEVHEDWEVHLADTGLLSSTGGRIGRFRSWIGAETFAATYCDGVSDVDLEALWAFHKAHGRLATLTTIRAPARFGGLELQGDRVTRFAEKARSDGGWINGGFFVFEPGVLDFIEDDLTNLEADVLPALVRQGELLAFRHDGYWQCMDTPRDVKFLEDLWAAGKAPWKVWA